MAVAELEPYVFELPKGYASPSQCNTYRDCPRCYFHAVIQQIPKPTSIHFAIGGGLHKTGELIGLKVIAGEEITKGDDSAFLDAAAADFEERLACPVDDEGNPVEFQLEGGKYTDTGQAKDDMAKYARVLVEKLPPLFRERGLIAVEMDLADLPDEVLAAAFPFPVKGRIDHVYGDREANAATGSGDLKSSSKMTGPDENGILQFCWYGLPAHLAGQPWWTACDIIAKKVTPEFGTYLPNGTGYLTDLQYNAAREIIEDTFYAISEGFRAFQQGDWRGARMYFPVGKGWNGKHDFDHGLPEYERAARGFDE